MGRMACINIRELPLQLLLKQYPQWRQHPVAVVEEEKPQSSILWVNETSRRAGILPGMRYTAALALNRHLRAGTVSVIEIERTIQDILKQLDRFSPEVEPAEDEPGIFWLNVSGLARLFGSLEIWAKQTHSELYKQGFSTTIVVGFNRFNSYLIAKARNSVCVLSSPETEIVQSRQVMLDCLNLDPEFRDQLKQLGIDTIDDFLQLPEAGVARRFGQQAHTFYRLAAGEFFLPFQPRQVCSPPRSHTNLDRPESNSIRLLFLIKQLLHPLLNTVAENNQVIAALEIRMLLENGCQQVEQIRPAKATRDIPILVDLIRLCLERTILKTGVIELSIEADTIPASHETKNLFPKNPRRNLGAALCALARIRAEFGQDSVVRARLKPAHLPEARVEWEQFEQFPSPHPRLVRRRPLVRRLYAQPKPLHGNSPGSWRATLGYLITGGWWRREIRREYHFTTIGKGETLWVYYDQRRHRWYVQGRVE